MVEGEEVGSRARRCQGSCQPTSLGVPSARPRNKTVSKAISFSQDCASNLSYFWTPRPTFLYQGVGIQEDSGKANAWAKDKNEPRTTEMSMEEQSARLPVEKNCVEFES